ncbi:MAG: hypothetical protein JWL76_493 [Thermoleophilia bacterium]|nr:hypothetical protein [Thermoleophilia bacterium]
MSHPDHSNQPPPVPPERSAEQRQARTPRSRRRTEDRASELDAWVTSRDGIVAHERALEDLRVGHVQQLDHAEFAAAFEVPWIDAKIEWTITDEFTRRHDRLRGRSHRAVAAVLGAFIGDVARLAPHGVPKPRTGLQLRRMPPDSLLPHAWALAWSNVGRATYLLEWRRADGGWIAHVTWLAIGPHGAPERRRWRGNA